MSNLINSGTCGYPLAPEERTTLVEKDGVMVRPAQQEPVAWPCVIAEADFEKDTITLEMQCSDYMVGAGQHWLSTTRPPAREPLSREQALNIVEANPDIMTAIRMTEAAHGITGEKK